MLDWFRFLVCYGITKRSLENRGFFGGFFGGFFPARLSKENGLKKSTKKSTKKNKHQYPRLTSEKGCP